MRTEHRKAVHRTRPVIEGGQNVEWTEKYDNVAHFQIPLPSKKDSSPMFVLGRLTLHVSVLDVEVGNSDRIIGSRDVRLAHVLANPGTSIEFRCILKSPVYSYAGVRMHR